MDCTNKAASARLARRRLFGNKRRRMGLGLALLAFGAYVSLGLPDGLLGVAWPSMRRSFALPLDSLGALLVTTTIGYMLSSLFSGRLLVRVRLGALLALSTFLAGAALVAYGASPHWWMVVIAGVATGLGGGGIDTALNIHVATHYGGRMMQWLHASYGVGAVVGPVVMTLAINSLGSWRWGYAIAGGFELCLAAVFMITASLWDTAATAEPEGGRAEKHEDRTYYDTPLLDTLSQWRVWLSIFLFFLYMGIEVTLATWSYTLLTESRGVSVRLAGFFMASYWGLFTVGRLAAGLFASRMGERNLVVGSLGVALVGAILLSLNVPGLLNLFACALVGLAISPILAALLSGTADRVGSRHLGNAMGIQIAAMGVGAAVVPSVTGLFAQRLSLQAIPPLLIVLMVILIGAYLVALAKGRRGNYFTGTLEDRSYHEAQRRD